MRRSELKFVISEHTADKIREWARLKLDADTHAAGFRGDAYRTRTLYFDTDEFDLFFRRASYARAKFRIRAYDTSPAIFLERKLKARDRVSKRRSPVRMTDLPRLSDVNEDWAGRWFARRLDHRGLRPVCQIAYLRTARIGESPDGPLRLTIDQDITATTIDSVAFVDTPGMELTPGNVILEFKYRSKLPFLFEEIIEAFDLYPQSISKYRMAVRTLGLADDKERTLIHA